MPDNPHKIQFHYHFIWHLVVNAVGLEIPKESVNVSFNTTILLYILMAVVNTFNATSESRGLICSLARQSISLSD